MEYENELMKTNILDLTPELQIKHVNEYVGVHTIKNCTYKGFLHAIDPNSNSVILSIPQDDKYQATIIPGHAILKIVKEDCDNIVPPQRKPTLIESKEVLVKRKNEVMAWFESHLLPVTESGDIILVGNVSLLPPYSILDLCTENPVIATQIKKIMSQMPVNIESK